MRRVAQNPDRDFCAGYTELKTFDPTELQRLASDRAAVGASH
jgi:hypothetical protein